MHVHVQCADGEANYWIEPSISLARNKGLSEAELRIVDQIIREHEHEIRIAVSIHLRAGRYGRRGALGDKRAVQAFR